MARPSARRPAPLCAVRQVSPEQTMGQSLSRHAPDYPSTTPDKTPRSPPGGPVTEQTGRVPPQGNERPVLTAAQRRVFDTILELTMDSGWPPVGPTYEEIAEACGYRALST